MSVPFKLPPRTAKTDGTPRKVGVELEFIGIEADRAARIVQEHFGGRMHEVDAHCFDVTQTRVGSFRAKLDTRFAHPGMREPGTARPRTESAAGSEDSLFREELEDLREEFEEMVAEFVGGVSKLWLPTEIVAPPVAMTELAEIGALAEHLRNAGARGTEESLIYAFGLQFNPELAEMTPGYLVRHLQAYLVLSPLMREEIHLHLMRRILPFVASFPVPYTRQVLAEDYAPDMAGLMADYLRDNATRNRELDLLPLFAHLDPAAVRRAVADERVKARPTFHYRLPDCRLGDPAWSVAEEWNRWVRVEELAADEARLAELRKRYRRHLERGLDPHSWATMLRSEFPSLP